MGMGIGYKIGNGNGKECAIGRNGNVKSHSRSSLLATDVPCYHSSLGLSRDYRVNLQPVNFDVVQYRAALFLTLSVRLPHLSRGLSRF